ncbi:MAG: hypothetical protein D6694_09140 [Gammaproteobacteria bacterium]|nr:MAG: hypothetical protein D6694_09140 [Gammaproteobacteria bacterium]
MPRITNQTVTERDLQEIQNRFQEMAKKPKRIKLQEALIRLAPAIKAMILQGYSLRDVCGVMEEYGIRISEATLKKMLESESAKSESAKPEKPETEAKTETAPGREPERERVQSSIKEKDSEADPPEPEPIKTIAPTPTGETETGGSSPLSPGTRTSSNRIAALRAARQQQRAAAAASSSSATAATTTTTTTTLTPD